MALPYYDLYERILRPKPPPTPAMNPKDVKQTMATYSVNEPQAVAILASLQTEGFALIQG
jgi:senataxin